MNNHMVCIYTYMTHDIYIYICSIWNIIYIYIYIEREREIRSVVAVAFTVVCIVKSVCRSLFSCVLRWLAVTACVQLIVVCMLGACVRRVVVVMLLMRLLFSGARSAWGGESWQIYCLSLSLYIYIYMCIHTYTYTYTYIYIYTV